jgi:hypothetical protein
MEDRCTPATLALTTGVLAYTAGSENNDFTITVSGANYVINDVVAISAIPTGWTGVGTETVTGPTAGVSSISVNLGGGSDVANIRSIAADSTITSSGSLTTNLSSNAPTNSGTLAGIDGNVTVTGSGGGTNAIVVSNSLAATGSTSTITASQVTGMLPSAKTVGYSNIGSLRVIGSNLGVNNFTVDVTTGSTALEVDTLGGNDTVAVQATSGATTVKSTSGSDTVTVGTTGNGSVGLDNITGALLIDEGTGTAKVLTVTDATSTAADPNVQITSSTITGLAPAVITYRATGGSFGGVGVTIDGSNTAATAFTLNGTLTSSNMTVNGDGGNDSFTVAASSKANLNGGSGNVTFNLGGNGVVLTGSIVGGAGTNTLTYASRSVAVSVNMTGAAAGTATGISGTFSGITALVGSSGSDTLTGTNATTAWVVSGANSGSITGGPSFTSFENLTGGSGADSFAFTGGSVSGSIIGSGGTNTLDYSGISATVAVTMTAAAAGTATDIGGTFANIATLIGDGATSTLTGPNATTAWGINGTNTGSITSGPAFSAFANLTGGSGADTFAFTGGSVSGSIDGGAGANTIDYSAAAGPTAIALTGMGSSVGFAGTAPFITGSFTNISTMLAAGGTSNSLLGLNATATWTVDEAGGNLTYVSGGQTLAFSNFQLLTGGSVADTFTVVSTEAGSLWTLNGGAGANVFNLSNLANQNAVITLLGGAGTNSLNVTDAGDTSLAEWSVSVGNIALNALDLNYTGISNVSVTTGSGQDYVDLEGSAVGGTLTLNLAGSSNELDVGLISNLYGLAGNVQVNLTNAASTGNVLTVNDSANAVNEDWTVSDSLITQVGAGSLSIAGAAQFGSIVVLAGDGGSTGNTFAVTASAASVISVDGGMGTNNSLIVHEGSSTGIDDGVSQVTFTGPTLQPVNYSDFGSAPTIEG